MEGEALPRLVEMETGLRQEPHCGPRAQPGETNQGCQGLCGVLVRGPAGCGCAGGELTHSALSCHQLRWFLDKLVHVLA